MSEKEIKEVFQKLSIPKNDDEYSNPYDFTRNFQQASIIEEAHITYSTSTNI